MRDQYVVAEKDLDNGYRVEVVYDTDPVSPREWSNVGHMACARGRYNLGDEDFSVTGASLEDLCLVIARHCNIDEELEYLLDEAADKGWEIYSAGQWREREALVLEVAQNWLAEHDGRSFYALPLYLYDHSGITMRTTPFSCPWDSGMVGMIFCSREEAVKEWGPQIEPEQVFACLRHEVEDYDEFLTGQVYGYIVYDRDGDEVDSCWGFYDGSDYCLEQGIEEALAHDPQMKLDLEMPSV